MPRKKGNHTLARKHMLEGRGSWILLQQSL